jgi:hypothetical protein
MLPGSPDLNSYDFFLWDHMRQLVYANSVNNLQELKQHIYK